MKTIVAVNLKGGAGKTNLSVHLALIAQSQGTRVALLDLDPTLSASRWLGVALSELPVASPTKREVPAYVQALRTQVDLLIIDTPAVLAEYALAGLEHADLALVPVHSGSGDLDQVADTQALLRMPMQARPGLLVRAVLNHTGRAPSMDRDTREVMEGAGLRVAESEIPFLKAYATAKGGSLGHAPHYQALLAEVREWLDLPEVAGVGA